ncbi:MAG: alpha/beta hydrolase [Candidatus Gracilibacteria bacterium]|nr:alpha/beta hydrolase [Candidatus Gracilibacteria bacterium]
MHIIFIHGTGGDSHDPFFDWTRKELEKLGHTTAAPNLPSTMEPDRMGWISGVMNEYSNDNKTVFIGRSLGGSLIPYLLENDGVHAHAAISIAAPITHLGWDNLKSFFDTSVDYKKAKASCEQFFHWYSDDDPHVPLEQGQELQTLLGGEYRVFKGYSHFYNQTFPEIIEVIENLP